MLINRIIQYSQPFKFKVKIAKTAHKYIVIGVADIKNQKAAQSSYGSGNAVAYYCNNGNRFPNMGVEGPGGS